MDGERGRIRTYMCPQGTLGLQPSASTSSDITPVKIGSANGIRTRITRLKVSRLNPWTIAPWKILVAVNGIEPSFRDYETRVLPLNYTANDAMVIGKAGRKNGIFMRQPNPSLSAFRVWSDPER